MALWKHYIVLFGGFYDPGVTSTRQIQVVLTELTTFLPLARYLNDLWLFDTQEYKWNQIEFREMDAKPS